MSYLLCEETKMCLIYDDQDFVMLFDRYIYILTADPRRSVQLPKQVVDFECIGGRYVTPRSPLLSVVPSFAPPVSSSY